MGKEMGANASTIWKQRLIREPVAVASEQDKKADALNSDFTPNEKKAIAAIVLSPFVLIMMSAAPGIIRCATMDSVEKAMQLHNVGVSAEDAQFLANAQAQGALTITAETGLPQLNTLPTLTLEDKKRLEKSKYVQIYIADADGTHICPKIVETAQLPALISEGTSELKWRENARENIQKLSEICGIPQELINRESLGFAHAGIEQPGAYSVTPDGRAVQGKIASVHMGMGV